MNGEVKYIPLTGGITQVVSTDVRDYSMIKRKMERLNVTHTTLMFSIFVSTAAVEYLKAELAEQP